MYPSFVAEREEREPRKPPIGVRATPTIQTSVKHNKLITVIYTARRRLTGEQTRRKGRNGKTLLL